MADKYTKEELEAMFQAFQPKYKSRFAEAVPEGTPFLEKIGHKLYGSEGMAREAFDDYRARQLLGMDDASALEETLNYYTNASKTPFSAEKTHLGTLVNHLDDGKVEKIAINRSPLGQSAMGAVNYATAHPGATFGTALNTGGAVAGLLDNDKFGGQLIGTAAGAILPKIAGMKLGPLAAYNVAMGAGNLGALFDTLRAKKEQQKQQQQYYGG